MQVTSAARKCRKILEMAFLGLYTYMYFRIFWQGMPPDTPSCFKFAASLLGTLPTNFMCLTTWNLVTALSQTHFFPFINAIPSMCTGMQGGHSFQLATKVLDSSLSVSQQTYQDLLLRPPHCHPRLQVHTSWKHLQNPQVKTPWY